MLLKAKRKQVEGNDPPEGSFGKESSTAMSPVMMNCIAQLIEIFFHLFIRHSLPISRSTSSTTIHKS
jgi:hypothetical protein